MEIITWLGLGFFVLGIFLMLTGFLLGRKFIQRREQIQLNIHREQTHSRILAMLETVPESYIIVDLQMRVRDASIQATTFGLIRDKTLRTDLADVVEKVIQTGNSEDVEFDIVNSYADTDSVRRVWFKVAKILDDEIIILFEDQTEKKRLAESRRDFLANASHELKTPVGAINLLAETLGEVSAEPQLVKKFSEKLMGETQRLNVLVQEIIQLSRLQEGDVLATPEIVSVDGVVAEAIDRMQVAANSRDIKLYSGGKTNLEVYGDFALLMTAVRNLLDNAIRYSRPQSRVSVGVSLVSKQVEIAVVDTGVGIAPELQPRVFERFYRGDAARSRDMGGSGLGLSIVKQVATSHGGYVKLWSEVGKGSTFTIVLPQAKR